MALISRLPYRRAWRLPTRRFAQLFLLSALAYLTFSLVKKFEFDVSPLSSMWKHKKFPALQAKPIPLRALTVPQASRTNEERNAGGDSKEDFRKDFEPGGFMEQQAFIQQRRHTLLAKTCHRLPQLSRGNLTWLTLNHLYADDKHKILYCFIPKVGCSNWKRVLMVLNGLRNDTDEISSQEAHFHNGMERLSRLSEAEQKVRLQTYTKFMYTRQPFMRVLSAYRNKFADVAVLRNSTHFQRIARRIMKRYRKNATPKQRQTGENLTWHEFVTYLINPAHWGEFNEHWQEMYKLCSPCQIHYHYLGKLETITDDAKYMLTSLGLQDLVSYPGRENSHPTNSSNAYTTFFSRVSNSSLEKLWNLYRIDFELFGYPKPDFM